MKKVLLKRFISLFTIIFFTTNLIYSQAPTGYYDAADQKKAGELKNAFFKIIQSHIQLGYYESSTYFKSTDWHPGGYFWDMYSNTKRTSFSGLNREHSMPKSWWSTDPESTVAYTDLHNLYPSDKDANMAKSNYPLGEVGIASFNNTVSKVGNNTAGTYTGDVFEPADEYKGDFARTYFYMVTCYQDYASNWRSLATTTSFMRKEIYPVFQTWSLNMLLKWHRDDPVSQKEIDRNNNVFALQQNRNPFVDYPELAEYIWGNKTNELFTVTNKAETPTLITPTNEIEVDFGEVLINETKVLTVPIRGKALTGYMTSRLINSNTTPNYFSIPSTSISTSYINRDEGYELSITYSPKVLGEHSTELVLYDGGFQGSVSVHISADCVATLSIGDELADEFEAGVYGSNMRLYFKNIPMGSEVRIYNLNGQEISNFRLDSEDVSFDKKGVFIVRIGSKAYKVIL